MNKTRITIGRNPESDICVSSSLSTVSSCHATIQYRDGLFIYTDHSTNGTLINNRVVHKETVRICEKDVVKLSGVYMLDWNKVKSLFPIFSRETTIMGLCSSYKVVPYVYKKYTSSTAIDDETFVKWNWGAFLSSWLWAAFYRKYWALCFLPLFVIPVVGLLVQVALSIYWGHNGSRVAWESGKYFTVDDYHKAQKKWIIVGIVYFLAALFVNILLYTYFIQLFGSYLSL